MQNNLEKLLESGHIIQIKPQGYSMYPLFIPGRDEALIDGISDITLKAGDVILYRRKHSILVLHRIYKITDKGIYTIGDNQTEKEGPIEPSQVKGILIAVIRNGKKIPTSNRCYKILSHIWLFLLPIRPLLFKIIKLLKFRS